MAIGANDFDIAVEAGRELPAAFFSCVQQAQARKIGQGQCSARVAGQAAIAMFRDMAEGIRPAVAEAPGILGRADSERIHNQDDGSFHVHDPRY